MIETIFTVKNQSSSERPKDTLPRHLHTEIFEKTPLINRLTILFQDCDPSLSIMPTIWKLMCLSASVRSSDRNHLIKSMERHKKNEKFLKTLTSCFLYQKLDYYTSACSIPIIKKAHLDRIFPQDFLKPHRIIWDGNSK